MELSALPLMLLLSSIIHPAQTEEKPKAVVILYPDKHEPTTVRCEIPGAEDDWKYSWFKDGSTNPFSSDREFSLSTGVSHTRSKVTCRGERNSDGLKSEISDAVTLNLPFYIETPKAVLTVQPKLPQILRGDTVTLTCNIQGEDWTYIFSCGDKDHRSEIKEFNIFVESTQTCKCSGWRRSSGSSKWSNEVTLTVSDIMDKPKISIKPQSSVFIGDTVTLSCDAGRSTAQIWYKDSSRIGTVDETKTLTDVKISDGGWYKCGVIAANNAITQSPAVRLTVTERHKALLRVQPDGGVFRGQTVNFTCHIPDSDVTLWSYSWNKDDSVIQDSESQEYRISSVDESHAGLYSCRGEETGGSRHTHTSDQHTLTVSGSESSLSILSALKLVSFLVAASPYLLVSIILGVKYCRAHAQEDEVDQHAATEE